jgi:N-acetylglucosamine-6-phosphate deacetylase
MQRYANATLILPDRLLPESGFAIEAGRFASVGDTGSADAVDLGGALVSAGLVDLHVHGGAGADFMDGTPEAFHTVCRCHARHGTTSLTPTSTVATRADYLRFLALCEHFQSYPTGGARSLGGHLYGPYFHPPAKGCHPDADFLTPEPMQDDALLAFAGRGLTTLTVAPETPGTERLVKAARERGLLVTAGHSFCTFPQMEAAIGWGVRHVDHLFSAMSDRARLRAVQAYPMRAGVMEATLHFGELTTEVIADGWHLSPELLCFAYKIKGPHRLALVTDSMRAVDCPDGEYWFGPEGSGERIRRKGNVGVTLDGAGLASGVMGLDHALRTMLAATGAALPDLFRMATLTPATVLGRESDIGSLAAGKLADFVVWNADLTVRDVYLAGERLAL